MITQYARATGAGVTELLAAGRKAILRRIHYDVTLGDALEASVRTASGTTLIAVSSSASVGMVSKSIESCIQTNDGLEVVLAGNSRITLEWEPLD